MKEVIIKTEHEVYAKAIAATIDHHLHSIHRYGDYSFLIIVDPEVVRPDSIYSIHHLPGWKRYTGSLPKEAKEINHSFSRKV